MNVYIEEIVENGVQGCEGGASVKDEAEKESKEYT